MLTRGRLLYTALSFTTLLASAGSGGGQSPEYFPQCTSPQLLAPPQFSGGSSLRGKVAAAWTGTTFGIAYVDGDNRLYFRRIFADGTPDGAAMMINASAWVSYAPGLVWTGTEFGVAWMNFTPPNYYFYFQRLSAGGVPIGSPTQVSDAPISTIYIPTSIGLAWSGSGYAVAWQDSRNFGANSVDIYATLLNPDGSVSGPSGAWHDLAIAAVPAPQVSPTIAWSPVAGRYMIIWQDQRSGPIELWRSQLNPADGGITVNSLLVPSGAVGVLSPSLVSAGNGLGLAWHDGANEIHFARLNNSGAIIGASVPLTSDPAVSRFPAIAWTGAEYGVFWQDARAGNDDIWFQRVSATGALLGGNQQVSFSADLGLASPVYAKYGYIFFASPYGSGSYGPAQAQPLACNNDYDPPTCPQGLVAYNITGTTASIGWVPSVENYSDIAYYEVYRNSVLQVRTSNGYFNDPGPLGLGTTYNYHVRPVNATQNVNGNCPNSIYVKTNASLTLTMNKSNPDAVLIWTDAGFNNYNVFRGTSPQVMQQIGATPDLTTQDPNALIDNINYFYTVDDPGQ